MLAQQPIVHSNGLDLVAFEVLSRIRTEEGELVAPNAPGGEVDIRIVDDIVIGYLPTLIKLNKKDCPEKDYLYFINLSTQTLEDDEHFDKWILKAHALVQSYPNQFVVEVCELISEELLDKRWDTMKEAGLLIALDDYGSYPDHNALLLSFPWDCCKFEADRVVKMEDAGALEYCRERRIMTVIERIETDMHALYAKTVGATLLQGFKFGKPSLKFWQTGLRPIKNEK